MNPQPKPDLKASILPQSPDQVVSDGVGPLKVPGDVAARMKQQGYNPQKFEQELANLQATGRGDEALRTYGLVMDRNRGLKSDAFGQISRATVEASPYQQNRVQAGANNNLSAWDDFGRSFFNGAVVRLGQGIQMLGTAVPKALDGAVNGNENWMREWQDANAKWYEDSKLFTTAQAEAGLTDKNGDINWRGVAGMMGNTLGMMAGTMLPMIGAAGRAGNALTATTAVGRMLASPATQSAAIGFMQMLPQYTDEARKAGYSPEQAMLASIPLAAVNGMLEHWGMSTLMDKIGMGQGEASAVLRAMRKEVAAEAFKTMAGKELSVESFKDVTEAIGKGFLERMRQPEVLKRFAKNALIGGATEGGEEVLQTGADYLIKGQFDAIYGNSRNGDGKGFDMTWQQTAQEAAIGALMGGVIGGSMGSIFSAPTNTFQQQTLFGKMDDDVKKMVMKGGTLMGQDPDQNEAVRQTLASYKLLNQAHQNGQITDDVFNDAKQKLDTMAGVSEQLARSGVNSPMARYGLFDLNNRQADFQQQFESQITGPMKRLNELATDTGNGIYVPKPGLPVLQLAEANQLISQRLPLREAMGKDISRKIDDYVSRIVNPDTSEEALRQYGTDIDTSTRQFVQSGQPQQTRFSERELPGLVATMETPNGRYALRATNDPSRPREVVEVHSTVDGVRPGLSEDRDEVINRFRGFKLPTKGKPVVNFSAVDDQTQNKLLDSFDTNPDLVQPYKDWRTGLEEKFADDPLVGLEEARRSVNSEAAAQAARSDTPDWERADLVRKRQWLRENYQPVVENAADDRYTAANYIVDHHSDWLEKNNVDPEMLMALPPEYVTGIYNALKSGNEAKANQLGEAALSLNELLNPNGDPESRPSALLAQFDAETNRVARRQIVDQLSEALRDNTELLDSISRYFQSGDTDSAVEKRFGQQLDELSAYQQQLADAIGQIISEQQLDENGVSAGSGEEPAAEQTDSGTDAGESADAIEQKPDKVKRTPRPKAYNPVARAPQSTREAILNYFAGGGRVRTADVKRYGDGNWMKGANGGNPLLSYITSKPENAEPLDNLARRLSENFPEAADEQSVMQMIMDTLSSLPNRSAKSQLIDIQQEPVEQQLGEDIPEYVEVPVMGGLFDAMNRAGIDNTLQEELSNTIIADYVTADGLDWLSVFNYLGFKGVLQDPGLKAYVFGEYLNGVANFVQLTPEEEAAAAKLTPSEIKEIMDGASLSDDVFQTIMESHALTEAQVTELNTILGAENPNPVDPYDVPIEWPGRDSGTTASSEEDEVVRDDRETSPAASAQPQPAAAPESPVEQPAPVAEETPAPEPAPAPEPEPAPTPPPAPQPVESPAVTAAVNKAVAEVDRKVAFIDAKIRQKEAAIANRKKELNKRTDTGDLDFGTPNKVFNVAQQRPSNFIGVADGLASDGALVNITRDAPANPNTTIQLESGPNGGFVGWMVNKDSGGSRIGRPVTYRNYSIEPAFTPVNTVINPNEITDIVTVKPATFNADGSLKEKGEVYYQRKDTYDQWRKKQGVGQQADLSSGQITGLEAEESVKNATAQDEAELAALKDQRANEVGTREKVAELARQNAINQQDLFATPAPEPAPAPAPTQQQQPAQTPEQARIDELLAKRKELAARLKKAMGSTLNSGINPEVLQIGLEYFATSVEMGFIKFKQFVKIFTEDTGLTIGDKELSTLKAVYDASRSQVSDDIYDQMDEPRMIRVLKLSDLNEPEITNDERTPDSVESDSPRTGSTDRVGSESIQPPAGGTDNQLSQPAEQPAGETQAGRPGDIGVPGNTTPVAGEQRNQQLPGGLGTAGTTLDLFAGANERGRGSVTGNPGVQPERSPTDAVSQTPAANVAATTTEKLAQQEAAESVPIKYGDRSNIDATLPFLMEGQREDVHFAETRFSKPDGFGVVFTNGTGTGKTFLGLGVIKRFVRSGKGEGIIVVPNDAVINEWVKSAPALGLKITRLTSTKDKGNGVSITTFDTFRQNNAIANRDFNFVVIDEAQNLMQSSKAETTGALSKLRAITLHPDSASELTRMQHPDLFARLYSVGDQITRLDAQIRRDDAMDSDRFDNAARRDELEVEYSELRRRTTELTDANKALVKSRQNESRPRALFLSATPFAYRENVQWAENYLFKYPAVTNRGYNTPSPYGQFMINHFGYRMRTGKLTQPEAAVDMNLMERQFNTHLREQGVLSARVLNIDSDYQRLFALTPSAIGTKIDEGMTWLREERDGRFMHLYDVVDKKFSYLERQRLLEAIKANEAIPLIKQWHALGKKVVVFYDYNQGGGFSPFDFHTMKGSPLPVTIRGRNGGKDETVSEGQLYNEFIRARPDLVEINTGGLLPPLQALTQAFPDAGVVNGVREYGKMRIQSIRDFNDDNKPESNILIVQSGANSGWSGHDTSGKHPRVLLNLGMPTAPTKAIQQEGRVYRTGQHPTSNSMFTYLNTGTGWERIAFANTISSRAGTAENLAMGQMARGLKDAFIMAFEDSEVYSPSAEEGLGGKSKDREFVQAISDFDRARSLYFAQQKKTARTKAAEGTDYYATPEPLGLKAVEWANPTIGQDVLEPSAGHGAIARWFPDETKKTYVEPSFELASRAALVTDGRLVNEYFEDFSIQNKFDAIVMNPPFGTAGKMASDHMNKAANHHLRNGGRLVAIVPVGSFNEKFDKWFYGQDQKGKPLSPNLYIAARVLLPGVAFERAGTKVMTQVLVIDRVDDPVRMKQLPSTMNVDLTNAATITEFFERIKDLELPERPQPGTVQRTAASDLTSSRSAVLPATAPAATTTAPGTAAIAPAVFPVTPAGNTGNTAPVQTPFKPAIKGVHTKYGSDIFTVTAERLDPNVYKNATSRAKAFNGYYSRFNGNGAIPGFIFKTQADADAFFNEMSGQTQPAQMQYDSGATDIPLTAGLIDSLQSFMPTAEFGNRNADGTFDQDSFDQAAKQAGLPNDSKLTGFRVGNKVYFNPSRLNGQTAMHEIGHVWASMMRNLNPAGLARGLELIAGSKYEAKFRNNPAYAKRANESQEDWNDRIREEALVEAIADKGARFLSSQKQSGFRQFLTEFWNGIKKFLAQAGITVKTKAKSLADATLDEYTSSIAGQMISGRAATADTRLPSDGNRIDAQIQMPTTAARPIVNPVAEGIATFRSKFESSAFRKSLKTMSVAQIADELQNAYGPAVNDVLQIAPGSKTANSLLKQRNVGPFKGAPGTLYDPATQTFNPDMLQDVALLIKGKAIQYGALTKSLRDLLIKGQVTKDWLEAAGGADTYIDGNGNYVDADLTAEDADLGGALDTIAQHKGPWGFLTRMLNTKSAGAITLPETIAHWLSSDAQSGLRTALVETRRAWVARGAELGVNRQQQIDKLVSQFAGLSLFDGKNPVSQVKMLENDGFADGKAAKVNLPVAVWMHLVATHRSQLVSHKGRSSVAADLDTAGDLVKVRYNSEGKPQQYGYDYKDPLTKKTTTYLFTPETIDKIEAGLNKDYKVPFDAAKEFFKYQPALDYLKGLHRSISGEELVMYADYFPTVSSGTTADPLTAMPRLLKNAKILQQREGLPMRVRGGDMLAELQNYARREEHYVSNVATLVNLQRWQQRHNTVVTQKAPKWVSDYLEELEVDLNDPSARARNQGNWTEVNIGGVDVGLRAMLKRFTTSVFSFSPALPLKQVTTMMQGVGLGIVENKYLAQATLKDLAPLFIQAYHVARQNDEKAVYGTELAETKYLEEMSMNKYLATVLGRAIGRSEAFIGQPSMADLKANPGSAGVAGARAVLHTISDFGLGAVRRSDRAVLLSFWKAAQYQTEADIAAGTLMDDTGSVVTSMNDDAALKRVADLTERLVYDTNQMTSESDRTPLQRDRSLASTLIGLYSGQQQRLVNTFMQKYADWLHTPAGAAKDAAFNQMLFVGFNNIVLNAGMMAVISMMWKMVQDAISGDDRDKEYGQTLAWDTARGILGSFPSLPTEAVVMITTMTDNQKWSSGLIEYAPGEAVAQTVSGIQQTIAYLGEEDEAKKIKLLNQITYNMADGTTKLTGLPNNLSRLLAKMMKQKKEVTQDEWNEILTTE